MTATRDLLRPFAGLPTALGELAERPDLPDDPGTLLDHLASVAAPMEQRGAAWQLLALCGLLGAEERVCPTKDRQANAMTPERKQTFLNVLSVTGSSVAAAQAATPWQTGGRGGVQSFYDERDRDPEFADAWKRAEQECLGRVEAEIMRRTMTPERRPIFSKGEYVGEQLTYDNRLLLRVAARFDPKWSERRQVEHSGNVQHEHGHSFVLEARDILLIPAERRELFMSLLEHIRIAKQEEPSDGRLIEHDPEPE